MNSLKSKDHLGREDIGVSSKYGGNACLLVIETMRGEGLFFFLFLGFLSPKFCCS